MLVKAFFDKDTYTLTYLVYDALTNEALLIDPVLNYDQASGNISFTSLQQIVEAVKALKLKVLFILETHAHADHLSSAQFLKRHWPHVKIAIGKNITIVQETFKKIFNYGHAWPTDGSQFDLLLAPYEEITMGGFLLKVLPTPGHTPACSSYLINNTVFSGDALFMPDYGTGRCDFPLGSAKTLYHSITQVLYQLPDDTLMYVGHDYQPHGRELRYFCQVKEQKEQNIHLSQATSEHDFIDLRTERDHILPAPKLLLPSIQVNIQAGVLPDPESNGRRYLKMPINE